MKFRVYVICSLHLFLYLLSPIKSVQLRAGFSPNSNRRGQRADQMKGKEYGVSA